MKLLINTCFLLLFYSISIQYIYSQNIFDYDHTEKFADYLFHSKDYQLAIQEFERLIFMNPENINAKLKLVKSYRYMNSDSIALKRFDNIFTNEDIYGQHDVSREYINLLINVNDYANSQLFLKSQNALNADEKICYQLFIDLYDKKWEDANNLILNNTKIQNKCFIDLQNFSAQAIHIKYKKPWVSGGLSSIIPGMGKIYSGYWRDGLISLLFVGITSWQAYRGFNKNGANSVYGWIYGGVGFGFYIGNIYGSVKAANKYNYTQDHKIIHQVDKVFTDYID